MEKQNSLKLTLETSAEATRAKLSIW